MRILFVYPAIDCPPGINHGLASMSGVLKQAGHEVRLLHVCDKLWPVPDDDEVLALVREYRPGVIGFSCMSQQYGWATARARRLKAEFPALPLVVGGVHVTMVPDQVLSDDCWDYVMPGEADLTFAELVRRLETGEDPRACPGVRIAARNGRPAVSNPVPAFPDLAALPATDFELFDLDSVLGAKDGWLSIITSRGCPYKCTYCFNWEIVDLYKQEGAIKSAREYLRHYPVERIIEEIAQVQRRHPQIGTVIFDDDLFTLNKPYVLEFCEVYRKSGIGLPFVVNAHVQRFDDDMGEALKAAGCFILKFGLESGSQTIRQKVLLRFMPNSKIAGLCDVARRHDLHTSAFVMMGLPGADDERFETRAQVEETLQLCAEVELGRFRWALFFPFPGTAGYEMAVKKNLIDWDKWKSVGNYFDGSCLDFTAEHNLYLKKLAALCNWYVNARTSWPSRETYAKLVRDVERMDDATFEREQAALIAYDRELSEELLQRGWRHYSIRYASVMGVDSEFLMRERNGEFAYAKSGPSWETTYTLD